MEIYISKDNISLEKIKQLANDTFIDFVKGVIDVNQRILGLGGELHADIEAKMLETGSKQHDLWGINIYPTEDFPEMVEFDSMINIRPQLNNHSRGVEDVQIRQQILDILKELIIP